VGPSSFAHAAQSIATPLQHLAVYFLTRSVGLYIFHVSRVEYQQRR